MDLVRVARELGDAVDQLNFEPPVHTVYNPLRYAWKPHAAYLRRYGAGRREIVMLGMNPGPFGMAQTGVPFGEIASVRDWLGIDEPVGKPDNEHPKRPITGFDCTRSEVSGRRVWGWAAERFGTPEAFFQRFLILNYCPLVFLEEGGRNRTPDKLPVAERNALTEVCDLALRRSVEVLRPKLVIGIGVYARDAAKRALGDGVAIGSILHPSPASPKANRGWAEQAEADLASLGVAI